MNVSAKEVSHEYDLVELQRNKLLQNADFENGKSSWNIVGENCGVVENEETIGKSGKIGKTSDSHANAHIWQEVTLQANTTYTLKAKVKVLSDDPTDHVTLDVKKGGVSQAGQFRELPVEATTKEWQDVELKFTTDSTTQYTVGIGRWIDSASESLKNSEIYLDNIEIISDEMQEDSQYEIIWADDFNTNALDTSKWGYELGCIRGVEQEHYVNDKENVFVDDGHLTLRITDRDKEDQYKNPRGNRQVIYNSGSIRTHGKQEFLYGRIEIKAKLPKGKGVFPAFWTLGSDFTLDGKINSQQGQAWPVCGEVDIMELIGKESDTASQGNQTVWQTLHYGKAADADNGKYAGNGKAYSLSEGVFNDDYHIFGLNWSKGKMEWYVDDQIVRTVDYSDDELAMLTLDRPQYVQLNLAAGGNWPGDAGNNLAGQEFNVDYIYYGQNEQQQKDAAEYYENAAKISGVKNVTMYQGDIPDLLAGVSSDKNTSLDFSVENEYMFQNKGGNTSVDLVCSGKDDSHRLATLPVGKYNIHYTAKDMNDSLKPGTRRTAVLTVKERDLATDLKNAQLSLEGYVGDSLSSITLPEGWSWEDPELIIDKDMGDLKVLFDKNGFQTETTVHITILDSLTKEDLSKRAEEAQSLIDKAENYTEESLQQLKDVLADVEKVLADSSASRQDIQSLYEKLDNAIKNLKEKEPEPSAPNEDTNTPSDPNENKPTKPDTETPTVKPNEDNPQASYQPSQPIVDSTESSQNTPQKENVSTQSVQTADHTVIMSYVIMAVISISVIGGMILKNKKRSS